MTAIIIAFIIIAVIVTIFIHCIKEQKRIEYMEECEAEECTEEIKTEPAAKCNKRFMEWKLPIMHLTVKAEYYMGMLVFTLIDRKTDQNMELGWWEKGEWYIMTNGNEMHCIKCQRMMIMIMKRYAARITRLQKNIQ